MLSLSVLAIKRESRLEYMITFPLDILMVIAATIIGSLILSGIISVDATESLISGVLLVSIPFICLVIAVIWMNYYLILDATGGYENSKEKGN